MSQIFLTVDMYLALMVVLVNLVFATFIMVRTSRTIIYIIFFFICISNMIWNFGDFMVYMTKSRFWFYLSLIGSGMLPALMYHWINTLVKPEQKSAPGVGLAYLISALLAFSSPLAMVHPRIQWFVDSVFWNILYLVLLGPFLVVGMVMLFNAIRRSKSADERSRLRYILATVITGVLTGLTDLVQLLEVPVPPLGHLGCLVYSTVLAVGVFKHLGAYDILAQMRMRLEMLSEMAAGIAHEIRNPLSSIKGASNLLSGELKNLHHPRIQEYCGLIAEETERLNNLLMNFQYFTRPLKVEGEPVSINEVIQKTVRLAEINTLDVNIRPELAAELPMVQADASLMKQVFLNLIKNAAEACGSGGELVTRTELAPPWVKISFSDNGPGIPPEVLSRIFDPTFSIGSM